MKKYIFAILTLMLLCLALCACKEEPSEVDVEIDADGYWVIEGERTNVLAKENDDRTNPQGLEFYLQPDGSYHVGAGKAKYLSKIVIPKTYNGRAITGINEKGFSNCSNLVEIVILADIQTIGKEGFFSCDKLDMKIPESVMTIGDMAFANCYALTEVRLSEGVTELGQLTFANCQTLENVYLPKSLETIKNQPFSGCDSITNVYYGGSKDEWSKMDPFTSYQKKNITFHYDYEG